MLLTQLHVGFNIFFSGPPNGIIFSENSEKFLAIKNFSVNEQCPETK